MWKTLLEEYDCDKMHRIQAIFSSIFVIQNRLQTAGEKIQTEISMKQWLLLAMIAACPKPHTLTNLGRLMGCSRQNVKKLATTLEDKDFVCFVDGENNSVHIELTQKVAGYVSEIGERHTHTLQLLFSEFTDEEIKQLFHLYKKLYTGIEKVENYAKELEYEKSEE